MLLCEKMEYIEEGIGSTVLKAIILGPIVATAALTGIVGLAALAGMAVTKIEKANYKKTGPVVVAYIKSSKPNLNGKYKYDDLLGTMVENDIYAADTLFEFSKKNFPKNMINAIKDALNSVEADDVNAKKVIELLDSPDYTVVYSSTQGDDFTLLHKSGKMIGYYLKEDQYNEITFSKYMGSISVELYKELVKAKKITPVK